MVEKAVKVATTSKKILPKVAHKITTSKSIKKPIKPSKVIEKKGKKITVVPKANKAKVDTSQDLALKKKTKLAGAANKVIRGAVIGSLNKKEEEKKYYTNFDFYFKRTSFRTMTAYYKQGF